MSNFDVHVGGQFLHEEALSRTRFAENEDHAPLDDDWQVAVFHSIVDCGNLRCFASPCRTISQGIFMIKLHSKDTRRFEPGSTRLDAFRLACMSLVQGYAPHNSLQVYCLVPAHQKKATGEPPL
jgi:hypothetical protein